MNCPKCGGEMWDNRGRKTNPKAPDFKCKNKDCEGVIWPPRGAQTPSASAPASAQQAFPARQGDDRSNRIERQHSQEMALRWFAMQIVQGGLAAMPTTEKLREMISWFQRDVGRSPAKAESEPEREQEDHGSIGGEPQPDDDEF